jgi:AmiR/NasT family two-component response regulator
MGERGSDEQDWAAVREALSLISQQASCTMEEALVLLRDTAESTDESIETVAEMVLDGTVRFD